MLSESKDLTSRDKEIRRYRPSGIVAGPCNKSATASKTLGIRDSGLGNRCPGLARTPARCWAEGAVEPDACAFFWCSNERIFIVAAEKKMSTPTTEHSQVRIRAQNASVFRTNSSSFSLDDGNKSVGRRPGDDGRAPPDCRGAAGAVALDGRGADASDCCPDRRPA